MTFNTEFPGQQVSGLPFAGDYTDWQTNPTRTAFASFAEALQAANDTLLSPGLDTIRVAGSANPIDVENATTPDDPVAGNALQVTDDLIIQGSGQGATVLRRPATPRSPGLMTTSPPSSGPPRRT